MFILVPPAAFCFLYMPQLEIFVRRPRFLAYDVEMVLFLCFGVSFLHIYFYIYEKFDCDVILRCYCLIGRGGDHKERPGRSWVEAGRGRTYHDLQGNDFGSILDNFYM
jgi:hypothetical protein